MFCSKCGAENSDNATVCAACGAKLKTDVLKDVNEKAGLVNGFIDKGIAAAGKLSWGKWVNVGDDYVSRYGIIVFYLFGLLALLCGIIGGIREECLVEGLKMGVIALFASILAGYFGFKLLGNIKELVVTNESKFANSGLLCCLIVLMALLTISNLVYGIFQAIDWRSVKVFFPYFGGALISAFCTICLLAPELIGVKSGVKCSAAEELIALLTLGVKVLMRLVPFVWCFGALYCTFELLIALGNSSTLFEYGPVMAGVGAIPLAAYLFYLAFNFVFDLYRAILCVPAKLDELKK